MKHLVFFDGECGLCDQMVQILLTIDKQELFAFAPLQGSTAKQYLTHLRLPITLDTLIIIENYQDSDYEVYLYGKAIFRICWLLGGIWKIPGVFNFLPSFLYDWAYKIVAKNRQSFLLNNTCHLPDPSQLRRFLP